MPYDPRPVKRLGQVIEQQSRLVYIPDSDNVLHYRLHGEPLHVDIYNTTTGKKDHKAVAQ